MAKRTIRIAGYDRDEEVTLLNDEWGYWKDPLMKMYALTHLETGTKLKVWRKVGTMKELLKDSVFQEPMIDGQPPKSWLLVANKFWAEER